MNVTKPNDHLKSRTSSEYNRSGFHHSPFIVFWKVGLKRMAFSLDGADALSFDKTIDLVKRASQIGLPIQINTTISRRNVNQINEIAEFISSFRITLWMDED